MSESDEKTQNPIIKNTLLSLKENLQSLGLTYEIEATIKETEEKINESNDFLNTILDLKYKLKIKYNID